ncbi:MAG: hypothetical protein J6N70_02585 [Oribacterium sp.]|nr:hypothetical protein [Oribacterium sp.]
MTKRAKMMLWIGILAVALGITGTGVWYLSSRPGKADAADPGTTEASVEESTEPVEPIGHITADAAIEKETADKEELSSADTNEQTGITGKENPAEEASSAAKTESVMKAAAKVTERPTEKTTTARTTERTTEKATTSKETERTTEKATTARTTERTTEKATTARTTEKKTESATERTTEKATTATAHKHTWSEVYRTVHHDAEYETVTEDAWDEKVKAGRHAFCKGCGMDLTLAYGSPTSDNAVLHIAGCPGGYVVKTVYDTIHHDAVTYQECVKEAWDEEVLDHLECTGCGATAKSWAEVK